MRPAAIAVQVEPLFLTIPEDGALARRPEHVERLARALAGGLTDYLARAPLQDDDAVTPDEADAAAHPSHRHAVAAAARARRGPASAGRAVRRRRRRATRRSSAARTNSSATAAQRLRELRTGRRAPQLVELERGLRDGAHRRRLRARRHAAHHRLRLAAQDGHRARSPAARAGLLAGRRPLPAAHAGAEPVHAAAAPRPHLEPAVRHLRDRPVLPPRQQGREPPQRVHDAQPGRARAARRRSAARGSRSWRPSSWARPASRDYELEVHRVRGVRRR